MADLAQRKREKFKPINKMRQKFTLITLGVRDFKKALSFYENLGWEKSDKSKGIIQLFIVSFPKVPEFWCSFFSNTKSLIFGNFYFSKKFKQLQKLESKIILVCFESIFEIRLVFLELFLRCYRFIVVISK